MRCRRAHELPDFVNQWQEQASRRPADILASMSSDLGGAEKAYLLQEFECGRAWLVYYFTLNLSHLESAPYKLLQLLHPRADTKAEAIHCALFSRQRRHPHDEIL